MLTAILLWSFYELKKIICDNNFPDLYPEDCVHPMDVFYLETKNVNRRNFRSGTMSASKVCINFSAYYLIPSCQVILNVRNDKCSKTAANALLNYKSPVLKYRFCIVNIYVI